MHSLRRFAFCAAFCGSAPLALAQSFQFDLDAKTSTSDLQSTIAQDLPGVATGNYDATTNTTGTQTRTGLFGGSGNQPITMNSVLVGDTDFVGAPSGTFSATLDLAAGIALISGVDVDLLNGVPAATNLTLNLTYVTFHTVSPTSIYPGGVTLPIPIGQVAVTNTRVIQSGPAVPGTLTLSAIPDVYDFNALVPTSLSFDIDLLGTPSSVGPVPFALPLIGTLDMSGAAPLFTLSASQSGNQVVVNPTPQTIDDLVLDLPTVLPTGSIAHLLLDVTVSDFAFDFTANLEWRASGEGVCAASTYCSSLPNTYSQGAYIANAGSNSLFLNDLELDCDGVPPFHAGRFYFGSQQTFVPFGDGNLCVGGTRRRLPLVFADGAGHARYALDFLDPLQPSALISAGSTWNFQFVYRDPIGGPLTFNTSDALQITFCP